MVTRTQRLIWTALPNGLSEDRRRVRLSAMLSPRLVVTPGPDDELSSFKDMLAWPAIVRKARFEAEFDGVVAGAQRKSTPDDRVHGLLFNAKTSVLARSFEDRRTTHVLSYPVAEVENDVASLYGQLAVEADGDLPLLRDMQTRFGGLGRGLTAQSPDELLDAIRQGRGHDLPNSPVERLNLVDLYNTPLALPETHHYDRRGPTDPREYVKWQTYRTVPLPARDSFRRTFDFHQIVTALAQYPTLLRLTALVVDLEIERDALPPGPRTAPLALRVTWGSLPETARAGVTLLPDSFPQTMTRLDDQHFDAVSSAAGDPPQADGFLKLLQHGFDVSQIDVNGSALKLRHFAINMFQHPSEPPFEVPEPIRLDAVAVPPPRTGTPALRSGGLTVALRRRGVELEGRFARSGAMEDALTAATPILLHQEDLVRGYHVEVRDGPGGEWRSLCRRDTRFTFTGDHSVIDSADNEGMLRLAVSSSADGTNPDVVKLHEGLFTWSGWSLTAPPIGRVVKANDSVGDADGMAPPGLPLDVDHRVRPRSLPGLRYGHSYTFRMRVADLAGNALAFDPRRDSPQLAETEPIEYLRYEPIEAPTVALVGSGTAVEFPGAGEDLTTIAIRSLNATPADNAVLSPERAQRHIVPPLSSERLAELHGKLDVGGRLDPLTYGLLAARDGALPEATHPTTGKGFPTAPPGFGLPFLPDPLADISAVRLYGRIAPDSVEVLRVPWYPGAGTWPDAQPFRVEILEAPPSAPPAAPELNVAAGVLRVPLAKADQVRLRVGHELSPNTLRVLGIWQWALTHMPADPAVRSRVEELARGGQHWMLTPWRDLELVHAVQKPLVMPAIEALQIIRATGSTVARLAFDTPVDTRSTEKLDLFGRWLDAIDDPSESGPRAAIGGGQRAAELKLMRLEAPGVNPPGRRTWTFRGPVEHTFGDTRYRRVGYHLTATTRFTKFLPPPLQEPDRSDDLTLTSAETIGFVPNSAPPPAPDVVYVIPSFGWSRTKADREERSLRNGGGLRVYLRRPWLVSGYMEMLGVVLPRAGEPSAGPELERFVTQWGADPTWRGGAVQGAAPSPASFGLAVTAGPIPPARLDPVIPPAEGELPPGPFHVSGLPLPGAPQTPALVDVVPHLVGWDPLRRLWYADIVIDPGPAYMPFIRLALARYQPISAPGSHLSPVTTTEVVQLLPDRLAVLTRTAPLTYRVGLFGHTPRRRGWPVKFEFERLPAGAGSDLDWEPLAGVSIALTPRGLGPGRAPIARGAGMRPVGVLHLRPGRDIPLTPAPPLIREVEIQLPRAHEAGERFRLVISELEVRNVDREHLKPRPAARHDPRRRIIYLEIVELPE